MSRKTRRTDPKLAIAYIRVSTTAERQELGATAQRVAIDAWAALHGIRLAEVYVEEVSGGASLDRRPVLLEALGAVAAHGASQLVVHRIDRFSREPMSAILAEAELQRAGATLAVVDGAGGGNDPTSELIRSVLIAVAKFDKSMIKARIRGALAVKRSRGERTGAPPFGMRLAGDGKHLEPCPKETAIIDRANALRASGASVRAIVDALGPVSRKGTSLTVAAVHKLVHRCNSLDGATR